MLPTDKIVERAIAWALEREDLPDYELRCLSFVEDAYEQANGIEVFGGSSARESADIYRAADSTGEPPAGGSSFSSTHTVRLTASTAIGGTSGWRSATVG